MGHLRDIKSNLDPQAFPGATFEIIGDVPAAQCTEARLEGEYGNTHAASRSLTEPGAFNGWVLDGKVLTITTPPDNAGNYDINSNNPNVVFLDQPTPIEAAPNSWYVHDGGALTLTRDLRSFTRYLAELNSYHSSKTGQTVAGLPTITDPGKFTDDLSGLAVRILLPGPPDPGIYLILSNTLDVLTIDHTFGNTANDAWYIFPLPDHQPYTIKGGKLFTSTPPGKMKHACSILFDPLT